MELEEQSESTEKKERSRESRGNPGKGSRPFEEETTTVTFCSPFLLFKNIKSKLLKCVLNKKKTDMYLTIFSDIRGGEHFHVLRYP